MAANCPAQIPRIPWTPAEDAALKQAVALHGDKRWSQISTYLPGRTSKACSHRWRTYLQPGVMHASSVPFSDWEKAVVKEAHKAVGNNWAVIARMLPGRTNAAVKNFWYSYRRRCGKAYGRLGRPSAADGNGDPDDFSDTDEEEEHDEDLGSADEMDCENGYEEECEDDDMVGADYGFNHPHTMEGVDCSAAWHMAGADIAGLGTAAAAAAAAAAAVTQDEAAGAAVPEGWTHLKQEQPDYPAADISGTEGVFMTPQNIQHGGQPGIHAEHSAVGGDHWPFAAVPPAAAEMHGSSCGAASNPQQTCDQLFHHQQHPQQQQQVMQQDQQQLHQQLDQQAMRSCMPRRSSHHSWSGAPRSFPAALGAPPAAAAGATEAARADLLHSMNAPAGLCEWDMQLAGPAAEAMPGAAPAVAEGDFSFAPMMGRVTQPRMSGHGFLEPQHRSSSRFISSNQLFEVQATPLPFSELHSRQITTSHKAHIENEPETMQPRSERPYKFALDLSAINESELEPTEPPAEAAGGTGAAAGAPAAAATTRQADAHMRASCNADGAGAHHAESACLQGSMLAGSSGNSTRIQQQWPTDHETIQLIINAAALKIQQAQQQQQQGEQGKKRAFDLEHGQGLQAAGHQEAAQGMFPPRKLVRPSLCSDAGTAPQQNAGASSVGATADAGAPAAAAHLPQQQQQQQMARVGEAASAGHRRFVLDLSDDALAA